MIRLFFFENLNHFLENFQRKTFEFSRVTLKEKRKVQLSFFVDGIGVDSYCFEFLLDVFVIQNRVIGLSKGLFR